MSSLNLQPGQSCGYEAYLEARVLEFGTKAGRQELEEQWKELRRRWYLGRKSFRDKLAARLESAVQGR